MGPSSILFRERTRLARLIPEAEFQVMSLVARTLRSRVMPADQMAAAPEAWTRRDWLTVAGLAMAMVLLRMPYSVRTDIFFNSDFAIVGLMAQHMRQGEWWTFYWGENRHGTFASLVTAATLWLTDWPLLQGLQVPPLIFQAAHVAVAYGFVRQLLGRWEALAYATLTLVPTHFFLFLTVRTSPNYSEVLTLGMASLWVLLRIHRTEHRSRGLFFFWGVLCGFGMWLLMYMTEFVVVALGFLALRWRFRYPGEGWHRIAASSHLRYWWHRGVAWSVVGWFLGYAPVVLHLFRGGRVATQIRLARPAQMLENVEMAFRGQVTHVTYPPPGWPAAITVIGVTAYMGAVLTLAWVGLRWWRESRRSGQLSEPLLFWLLLPVSWGMFVASRYAPIGAERYLWPYQLMLPLAVAILARESSRALRDGRLQQWAAAGIVGGFLLFNGAAATLDFRPPAWPGWQAVLALLEREGVRAGFADYWVSYYLTLLADEKLIIAPYKSLDRYPPYTLFALSQRRVALILNSRHLDEASAREFWIKGRGYRQRGADHQVDSFIIKFLEPIAP